MMNTLANHGFLPRDGHNITKDNAVAALGNGLNFDATLAGIMWEQALVANPEPNATFFTLDNLNRHNVLEHDASISRTDAYFGNNHVFNQTVFDTSKKYWTTEMLSAQQLANTKIFRQVESRSANPNYTFTAHTEPFSLGEMAAPLIVFGDMETALANRTFVEYFFGMILSIKHEHREKLKTNLCPCLQRTSASPRSSAGPRRSMPLPSTRSPECPTSLPTRRTSRLLTLPLRLLPGAAILLPASHTDPCAGKRRNMVGLGKHICLHCRLFMTLMWDLCL